MCKVSVVIRCYNEEEHIGRLLSGILEQTVRDVEIVVVDSGSTDATLSIAARYPVRIVHIEPAQFSFGRSLNKGCAAATGEILVFASAHVYPLYEDWLERLLEPLAVPGVGLAYGCQRGDSVTKYSEHQVFARWFPPVSTPDQKHPFCNNANAAVRRSLWERFPYDESLTGLEDLDWAARVMAEGYRIAYVAQAVIAHVHNETPARIFNRYTREAIALRRIMPDVRFTALDFARLLATNIASDLYHAVRDRVFWRSAPSIFVFRTMQFLGTYSGHNRRAEVTARVKQTFYYPRGLARHAEARGAARPINYNRAQPVADAERAMQ